MVKVLCSNCPCVRKLGVGERRKVEEKKSKWEGRRLVMCWKI